MTAPQKERTEPTTIPVPPNAPEDGSSLIPALLATYAAYRLWRGGHDRVPHGWQQLAAALRLHRMLAGPLSMLAQRSLDQHRRNAGRAGDELWTTADAAVAAGVEAGVQMVAEGLLWTDQHTPKRQDPVTRQGAPAGHPGPFVPTSHEEAALLGQMTASAVVNAVAHTAGSAAGWEKKKWNSMHDSRVRATHTALDGTVTSMKDVFVSPSGARLRFPGDPRAPMAERANCRCYITVERR